jgi:hypothetical protein
MTPTNADSAAAAAPARPAADRLTPPVVHDRDRAWAMAQCPPWCRPGDAAPPPAGEIVDDGAPLDLAPDATADAAPAGPRAPAADADGGVIYAAAAVRAAARYEAPAWGQFVDEQIEQFERYFAGDRKSPAEWSRLFRSVWWPKADPSKRYPKSKPLPVPEGGYVFVRRGTALHRAALQLAPDDRARRVWAAHGVQFAAGDPLRAEIRRLVDAGRAA